MIYYPSNVKPSTDTLGGKGISLITMHAMGLKVPRAFIMPVSHKSGTERYALYREGIIAVSYTHLTLPTILLV